MYKRSGVVVSDISRTLPLQTDLFDPVKNRKERSNLMKAIVNINHRYEVKSVLLGVEGEKKQPWKLKCEHRSPNYLTDLNEILTIRA